MADIWMAEKHAPTLLQGFRGWKDYITQIYLGERIPRMEKRPVLYYKAFEDFPAVLYCWFHRYDWSETGGFIGDMDSHAFDFEGALYVQELNRSPVWITIFHNRLKFYETESMILNIEAHGHGVYMDVKPPAKEYVIYNRTEYNGPGLWYQLVDMMAPQRLRWFENRLTPLFNKTGVHLPWQWDDWVIKRKFGKQTEGLIWENPAKLLELARRAQVFKRKSRRSE